MHFSARFEDGGQYKVKAHNEAGEAVSLAPLNVFEPPPSIVDSCKFSESYIGSKVRNFLSFFSTHLLMYIEKV